MRQRRCRCRQQFRIAAFPLSHNPTIPQFHNPSGANPIQPEDYRHRGTSAAPSDWGKRSPAASEQMETRHPAASSQATNLPLPSSRVEYRAGNALPVASRTAAPVNSTWPDTGFWISTNSNKRHNRKCENYRKTRGYPCSASEGTPCGKCGG